MATKYVEALVKVGEDSDGDGVYRPCNRDWNGFATVKYYTRAADAPKDEPSIEQLVKLYNQHHRIVVQEKSRNLARVKLGLKSKTGKTRKVLEEVDIRDAKKPVEKAMPDPMENVGQTRQTKVNPGK